MKKLLMIDNYDSFTYNLVQYVEELALDATIDVVRNDQLQLKDVEPYDAIILSPGPGLPKESGLLCAIIERYVTEKPILGVCLGHQAIGEFFGGCLTNLSKVYHGVATPINILKSFPLFEGLEANLEVGRYHSWVVDADGFPEVLEVLARDEQGQIMALAHKELPVYGVQFHPESVLTPDGKKMMSNFLKHVAQVSVRTNVTPVLV